MLKRVFAETARADRQSRLTVDVNATKCAGIQDDTTHLDLVNAKDWRAAARGATRKHLYVSAEGWFAGFPQCVEAGVAQFQAQQVFALGMEGAVAFMTSCIGRALCLFSDANFGIDLEGDLRISPKEEGAREMPGFGVPVD